MLSNGDRLKVAEALVEKAHDEGVPVHSVIEDADLDEALRYAETHKPETRQHRVTQLRKQGNRAAYAAQEQGAEIMALWARQGVHDPAAQAQLLKMHREGHIELPADIVAAEAKRALLKGEQVTSHIRATALEDPSLGAM